MVLPAPVPGPFFLGAGEAGSRRGPLGPAARQPFPVAQPGRTSGHFPQKDLLEKPWRKQECRNCATSPLPGFVSVSQSLCRDRPRTPGLAFPLARRLHLSRGSSGRTELPQQDPQTSLLPGRAEGFPGASFPVGLEELPPATPRLCLSQVLSAACLLRRLPSCRQRPHLLSFRSLSFPCQGPVCDRATPSQPDKSPPRPPRESRALRQRGAPQRPAPVPTQGPRPPSPPSHHALHAHCREPAPDTSQRCSLGKLPRVPKAVSSSVTCGEHGALRGADERARTERSGEGPPHSKCHGSAMLLRSSL